MLADQRDRHRVSALWVAETLQVESVTPKVIEIASHDPVPEIRRRAQVSANRMIERISGEARGYRSLLARQRELTARGAA